VVRNLQGSVEEGQQEDESYLYGLTIFWGICCDETSNVSAEVHQNALAAMEELF